MTTFRNRAGFALSELIDEKRHAERKKSFADIWIDPGDLAAPVYCKVLDVSRDGARLTIPGEINLPAIFSIRMGSSRYEAKVIWKSGRDIGAEFLKPIQAPPPEWKRSAPALEPPNPQVEASNAAAANDPRQVGEEESGAPAVNKREPMDAALARLAECLDKMKK